MVGKNFNLALIVLFFVVLLSQSVLAVTNVTSCGVLSTAGETYNQINDITNDTLLGPCIEITAPNIIFNGDGYFISSDDTEYGIKISSVDNVTVKNTNVSMSSSASGTGIVIWASDNSYLFNNTLKTQYRGMTIYQSLNSSIKNNTISGSIGSGAILVYNSSYTTIDYNNISLNEDMGIYLYGTSSHNVVSNNDVINNTGAGVSLYDGNGKAYNTTIEYNNISLNVGIGVKSTYSTTSFNNSILRYNNITANSNQGVILENPHNSLFSYNHLLENGGSGIEFRGSGCNNTLTYNEIDSNSGIGIYIVSSADNFSISYNVIKNNNGYGISSGTSSYFDILYNNISSNNGSGIDLSSVSYLYMIYNNISSNNGSGIDSPITNGIIENNTMDSDRSLNIRGIYSDWSNNVSVKNNTFNKHNYEIIFLYSENLSIVDNTVNGSSSWGIYLHHCNYSNITNNIADNSTYQGIAFNGSYNNNVSQNIARGNGEAGIYLEYTSNNNTIENNTLQNNSFHGVWSYGCNKNDISRNIVTSNGETTGRAGIYLVYSNETNVFRNTLEGNYYGIKAYGSNNNSIYRNTINDNLYGIQVSGSSSDNLVYNNRLDSNGALASISTTDGESISIYDSGSDYNNFTNNLINNSERAQGYGIADASYTSLINETILNSYYDGIETRRVSIMYIINTTISNSGTTFPMYKDIALITASVTDLINLTLTNCSYDTVRFSGSGEMGLTRKWYFRLNVSAKDALTDKYLINATSPKAYIYDKDNNSLQTYAITNGTTLISTTLTEYVNRDGVKTYSTPNAIFVDAEFYYPSNQTIYDLTSLKSVDSILVTWLSQEPLGFPSPSLSNDVGVAEVVEEPLIEKTFCGDGICQELNDYGIREDFWSCPTDCSGFDIDSLIFSFSKNCWDGDPSTICFFTQQLFSTLPGPEAEPTICGNEVCEKGENCLNCPKDCGTFKEFIMRNLLLILLGILGIVYLGVKLIGRKF